MNFLAHLFLAYDDPDLMIGNFIADFLRGKQVDVYSDRIKQGIQLHRKIDAFTDDHEEVRKSIDLIRPRYKKYAPVIVDIYYDFFLGINWSTYANTDLDSFAQGIYKLLMEQYDILPEKLQVNLPTMIGHNWLVQYSTHNGMDFVFNRMAKRTKFKTEMEFAGEELRLYHNELNEHFNNFFPDVIQLCQNFIADDKSNNL